MSNFWLCVGIVVFCLILGMVATEKAVQRMKRLGSTEDEIDYVLMAGPGGWFWVRLHRGIKNLIWKYL